jgi:cyclase
MMTKRLVVCLDVLGGRVVKGVQFVDLRDQGEPTELAARYEREGADEIVFLDIGAAPEERATLLDLVQRTAERLFIPLTVGGGIRSAEDVARTLRSGADKVTLNTAAVERPEVIRASADRFGAQCVVVSIDAARHASGWRVYVKGGRVATDLDAIEWAKTAARHGAGELLVTSIDRDGSQAGYDLDLLIAISRAVDIPVVASGGAGTAHHLVEALTIGQASAALVAGILHQGQATVRDLKEAMIEAGIPTRRTW